MRHERASFYFPLDRRTTEKCEKTEMRFKWLILHLPWCREIKIQPIIRQPWTNWIYNVMSWTEGFSWEEFVTSSHNRRLKPPEESNGQWVNIKYELNYVLSYAHEFNYAFAAKLTSLYYLFLYIKLKWWFISQWLMTVREYVKIICVWRNISCS